MKGLYIVRYKDIDKNKWDEFVDQNDSAWFWHTSSFQDAWPYGMNLSFAILNSKDEILLEQSLYLECKNNLMSEVVSKIPYIKRRKNSLKSIGGIAWKDGLTEKQIRQLQKFYKDTIDGVIIKYNVKHFDYSIQATLAKSYFPNVCPLVNPLIFYGFCNAISQAYIIDLNNSLDDIYHGFQQTKRNLINRCKKAENIKVVEAKSCESDLEQYYQLHVQTYRRTGAQPHPRKYFQHIFFKVLKRNMCRIVFLYKDDKLVAAQNTLMFKDVALYWTGASLDDRGEGENRLLMFNQIAKAKELGLKYYEVGEAFPNVRSGKLKGLNDYKKSFGGIVHPIFAGKWNCNINIK